MPSRPAVRVVIPDLDRARLLEAAIRSALAQTVAELEVVVVDEGRRDSVRALARRLDARRVRVLRPRRPGGPAAARNLGWRAARAPLVAFLDSDDLWRPEKLARQLPHLAAGKRVIFTDFDLIDARGRVLERRCLARRRLRRYGLLEPLPELRRAGSPRTSTVLVRRADLSSCGGFDESFRRLGEDSELWLRLLRRLGAGAFQLVPESLAAYRWHGGGQSVFAALMRAGRGFERAGPRDRERLVDYAVLALKRRPSARLYGRPPKIRVH